MNWLKRQYNDIKGHFKWALLGPLWAGITWAANQLLHMIPNMPTWAVWVILFVLSFVAFVWVAASLGGQPRSNSAQTQNKALMGTAPADFDYTTYFQQAYASSLQADMETRIRTAAALNQPADKESFYVKLIAVGGIAYAYDITWAYIFRSQVLLLMELNRKVLLLAQVKPFYDKAASVSPTMYANYSFEAWMGFLTNSLMLIHHPNGMVEITLRGRDFLKYLVHWGRSADDRKY